MKNILNFNKKYIPVGGSLVLIKKFPIQELKNIARLECNIDGLQNEEDINNTILASKKLRHMLKISEKSVCFNCTKKSHCKFFEEIFVPPEIKNKNIEEKANANMTDLQMILNGLYKIANGTDNSGNNFNEQNYDLKYLKAEQDIEYDKEVNGNSNLIEQYSHGNYLAKSEKISTANFTTEDLVLKRIPNKEWTSASILTEIINETMEDFLYNNGIAFRTLYNAYLETKKQEEQIELLAKEKLIQREEDPIVKLIEDLKKCRNRKDKRRLLAKYNKTANFGWGEYFKINKKVDEYAKEAERATDTSERDNEILQKEKMKNNNNNNTLLMTESRLKRINSVKNVAPIKTQNFSQKITEKTAQKKYLESQQNLSLLSNQAKDGEMHVEQRTFVKLPGKEMKRAIGYLNSKNNEDQEQNNSEDKIQKFNAIIDEKRKLHSVDINSNVKSKWSKLDKKLEENRKFTLTPLIPSKINERDRHIESINHDNLKLVGLEEFSLRLEGGSENSLIEHQSNLISLNRKSNELSSNIENIKDEIMIEKVNNSTSYTNINDIPDDGQLTFYKQKNLTKEENIKKKQFTSKINKMIENKHIYKSQNFYNNTNMENFPYETDADISRTIRFQKTIKKEEKVSK